MRRHQFLRDGVISGASSTTMAELFDKLTDLNSLYASFRECRRGCDWKMSTQKYWANCLLNIRKAQHDLALREYKQKPFFSFTISERGKTRRIRSMHISDRVVIGALCKYILVPELGKKLIYDNGASVKGKGISFSRRRIVQHLRRFYRESGTDGYILQIDFSKFFDNIDHDAILNEMSKALDDPALMQIVERFVREFAIDISYIKEEDREEFESKPFNLLEHNRSSGNLPSWKLNRGVAIGSEVSQVCGVFIPTRIDTYCKTVRQCKFYGRYMDDIYIIHKDKQFLKSVLEGIKEEAKMLRLFINEKKTHITPLKRGFSFLQNNYSITCSGRIIIRPSPRKFSRERRKLKKYKSLLDEKKMTRLAIFNAYKSWRGNMLEFDCHKSIKNMDALYNKLFFYGD